MSTNNFVASINATEPSSGESIYDSLLKDLESVVVQSVVTSFGLDAIFSLNKYGGDVDTIHNVRKIGSDSKMEYKSEVNKKAGIQNGKYNSKDYHAGGNYRDIKHNARQNSSFVKDEYTGKNVYFNAPKKGSPHLRAELDHVKSAKSIHEDRGRILSGLSGPDLANSPENLKFTNKKINASMGASEIPEYLAKHPEIDSATRKRMEKFYNESVRSYEQKIANAYYTSPAFAKDTAKAAGKVAGKNAVKQVLGFVFMEIWFAVRHEMHAMPSQFKPEHLFESISKGFPQGVENIKTKHYDLWAKLGESAIAGALASLTTTLTNIFATTAKNVVRIIRQIWSSLIEALRIAVFNPDNLPMGERMRAVLKILATAASVVAGTLAAEAVAKSGIDKIPVVGEILPAFMGSFITGIMTVAFLTILDRSSAMQSIVDYLDNLRTPMDATVDFYRQQAELMQAYAVKLENIDLSDFKRETASLYQTASLLDHARNEEEVNIILRNAYDAMGLDMPWGEGTLDDFMARKDDPGAVLRFGF